MKPSPEVIEACRLLTKQGRPMQRHLRTGTFHHPSCGNVRRHPELHAPSPWPPTVDDDVCVCLRVPPTS